MVFNSWIFVVFLAFFMPVYLLVRRDILWRNVVLIVASYVFYGWWDARFLILVAVSIAVDYLAALGASGQPVRREDAVKSVAFLALTTLGALAANRSNAFTIGLLVAIALVLIPVLLVCFERLPEGAPRRRAWLTASLCSNLGILAVFKYFNFFVTSAGDALTHLGMRADFATIHVILPVGLSFYTFQAISRSVDSYRGVYRPQRSIITYAAFHAFFPQLVAGPIERAGHLMPQFESVRPITRGMLGSAAMLIVLGLFQKIVIADNVAPIADLVFDSPATQTGGSTIAGILAFTFQIYGDFGGYSNMARGVALLIGFDLMRNFDHPYFARTPREFWQRWHISLSRWLRDYLYIPLGGSRSGRTSRNLMITMLLGGLWHGAAWTFVAWGALHGFIQVAYRWLGIDAALDERPPSSPSGFALHLAAWAATFTLVMIAWVFFRAHTFATSWAVFAKALEPDGYEWETFRPLLNYVVPMVAIDAVLRFRAWVPRPVPFLLRYSAAVILVMSIIAFSGDTGKRFIYFDF